jgi:DNA-binding NtrC family response regulator
MSADILIVDDEPDIRALIEGILTDEGYETRQAHNSDAALKEQQMMMDGGKDTGGEFGNHEEHHHQ